MRKKIILVTGLHGYVGSRFAEKVGDKFHLVDMNRAGKKFPFHNVTACFQADITDRRQVYNVIKKSKADFVLHLAAKTHIDACEKDRVFKKESETWRVNVDGSRNIAEACSNLGIYLLYTSTECVFDGQKGFYKESDTPQPKNHYGLTKLMGEEEVIKSNTRGCILRSVLTVGHHEIYCSDLVRVFYTLLASRRNVTAVNDQWISITFIDDLVEIIMLLLEKKALGLYHYAGKDALTPYEIALYLAKFLKLKNPNIIPQSLLSFFGEKAKLRLTHSSLSTDKIGKKYSVKPRTFKEVIDRLPYR